MTNLVQCNWDNLSHLVRCCNAGLADKVLGFSFLCHLLPGSISWATGLSSTKLMKIHSWYLLLLCNHLANFAVLQTKIGKSGRNQILILSYSRFHHFKKQFVRLKKTQKQKHIRERCIEKKSKKKLTSLSFALPSFCPQAYMENFEKCAKRKRKNISFHYIVPRTVKSSIHFWRKA